MARKKKTMDGNNAAAHVAYAFTEVAAIYPITPSSVMAEVTDEWAVKGKKNLFGQTVKVVEMQSEAGAAGTVHGSLAAGALTTTFTASQGLLLMIPNLYKIAGERLPGVFYVAARAIAAHALSIFGDQSDIYACRQTGVAMLACSSVQEVMDISPVSHASAMEGSIPFINFFDGFRTSHEMQKIDVWSDEDLHDLMPWEAVHEFRQKSLNPNHGKQMGSAQNPDIFFQSREASNTYYDQLPTIVKKYFDKVNQKLGTNYSLFNYYGAPDAEHVIVAMGSVCETIEETIDQLNRAGGKFGLLKVRLYRPFVKEALLELLPETTKQITVLDRTKEPGSLGEPLYLDVVAALYDSEFSTVPVYSGRYGLGSKDTTPGQIAAVYQNQEKKRFTIGIVDDVTNLSLETVDEFDSSPEDLVRCKFWGLGADGTVGANKNSIKIIGDNTDMYVQAYFDYDSKKSGGVTVSHLRFGHSPIKSTYLIKKADFVACHHPSYVRKYDMVQELKNGGTFLLNCSWNLEELEAQLPGQVKKYIADHNISLYTIDGVKIGRELGLGGRINTILQSAFFSLSGVIPKEDAIRLMKEAAKATYGNKGDKVVQMNYQAIDQGVEGATRIEIPASWSQAEQEPLFDELHAEREQLEAFVNQILIPANAQKGNDLPVSAMMPYSDGSMPSGSAAFEKRGIAVDMSVWVPENCIQCTRCSYVCPHAAIRPVAMTQEEAEQAPEGMKMLDMVGMPTYRYAITVSALDCTGCGSCYAVCPGKKGEKALAMRSMPENKVEQTFFDYGISLPYKPEAVEKFKINTVKGSQFRKPLLEFSGACAGCGETPYAKLVTQLYGDRMYIANATGCSSIWGNSAPATPYTVNAKGQGPAWSNSLFEDAAEFGYGMKLAQVAIREELKEKVEKVLAETNHIDLGIASELWLKTFHDGAKNADATDQLIEALLDCGSELCVEILADKSYLSKKSQWIFGGDGWAYDIGFGGLDHVLASGQDINILVFDTEVYSNTGGQASKASSTGVIAQFAAGGKEMKKKDLAGMAMSYKDVYVAQIAMGSDFNQAVKAITEAEAYPGPSLIIAYAPCILHGIKNGMGTSQIEEEKAVKSGYWHCFRYNPQWKEEGKPLFVLDSKEPTEDYKEFLAGEVRYNSLQLLDPEKAERLFEKAKENAKQKYEYLKKLTVLYGNEE